MSLAVHNQEANALWLDLSGGTMKSLYADRGIGAPGNGNLLIGKKHLGNFVAAFAFVFEKGDGKWGKGYGNCVGTAVRREGDR